MISYVTGSLNRQSVMWYVALCAGDPFLARLSEVFFLVKCVVQL